VDSSGVIHVPGADLAYQAEGEGVPVIVLHGGPGLGCDYLRPELAAALSDAFRLFFLDQRASGRSGGAGDPSRLNIYQFVSDLDQVREKLGQEQIVLLGHSFGGLLAIHYGIEYPDRVKALVLVDSDPASKRLWSAYEDVIDGRQTPAERNEMAAIQAIASWQHTPDLIEQYFQISLRPYFAGGAIPPGFGRRFTHAISENLFATAPLVRKSLGQWDLHPALHRIECPVLILAGESSIFPPEAIDKLHSRLRNSSVAIIPGASHFPQVEAQDLFEKSIRLFLARDVYGEAGWPGESKAAG